LVFAAIPRVSHSAEDTITTLIVTVDEYPVNTVAVIDAKITKREILITRHVLFFRSNINNIFVSI